MNEQQQPQSIVEPPPPQDLGIAEIHKRDIAWTAGIPMVPNPDRLAKPHSVVTVVNTDPEVVHVLIDRNQQPITLMPGQRMRGVEMLDSELENFAKKRAAGRFRNGRLLPQHPLMFEDIEPFRQMHPEREQQPEPAVKRVKS